MHIKAYQHKKDSHAKGKKFRSVIIQIELTELGRIEIHLIFSQTEHMHCKIIAEKDETVFDIHKYQDELIHALANSSSDYNLESLVVQKGKIKPLPLSIVEQLVDDIHGVGYNILDLTM